VIRIVIVLIAVLGLLVVVPSGAADGNGAQTYTATFHGDTVTFVGTGTFCEFTPPVLITNTLNGVVHLAVLENGTMHFTNNLAGTTTTIELGPDGVTFTGHVQRHVGENDNQQNETLEINTNVVAKATEGPMQNAHAVEHLNTSATGDANVFFQLNCGGSVMRSSTLP
jgi:hypothetical protein